MITFRYTILGRHPSRVKPAPKQKV
jgi:hypothetical protein